MIYVKFFLFVVLLTVVVTIVNRAVVNKLQSRQVAKIVTFIFGTIFTMALAFLILKMM